MTASSDGYLRFYKEALFSDLELHVGDETYHLHQLIVGNASEVFARAVSMAKMGSVGSPLAVEEAKTDVPNVSETRGIELKLEKCGGEPWRGKLCGTLPRDAFSTFWPELIEYMYTGQMKTWSTADVVGWFCIATDLELLALKNELIEWIVSNITPADIFTLLPQILPEPRAKQLLRFTISLIAKNFSDFVEADRRTRALSAQTHPSPSPTTINTTPTSTIAPKSTPTNAAIASPKPTTQKLEQSANFEWRLFPFDAMRDLLHDKNLFAASEDDVFEAILRYLEQFEDGKANANDFTTLFETVRFERLEYATLEAALAHPLVPKELLSRALMARLAGFEKPSAPASSASQPAASPGNPSITTQATNSTLASRASPSSQTPGASPAPPSSPKVVAPASSTIPPSSSSPQLVQAKPTSSVATMSVWNANNLEPVSAAAARDRRRQSYGRLFQWSSDFDTKGVLYYLGTREYRSEWQNPYTEKFVDVTWSSLEKGKASAIFEREPSECWTQDVPSSWLTVDLGVGRSLRITAYTLRHGGGTKQDLIRNWTLKGSVDGKEFVTLMRHKDDESLSTPFATMTWPIGGITQSYRYFKIIQTGHNSSKHNFLSIGGVEFYGELIFDITAAQKVPS